MRRKRRKYRINWSKMIVAILAVLVSIAIIVFAYIQCSNVIKKYKEKNSQGPDIKVEDPEKVDPSSKMDNIPDVPPTPQKTEEEIQQELYEARRENPYAVLINKTHAAGADYKPDDLVRVSDVVEHVGNENTKCLRKDAAEALNQMIADAKEEGIYIKLRTGYRTYEYQNMLFNSYVKNHGEKEANTFSAKPGESEHQTGLACDLAVKSNGYALTQDFANTKEGKWVYEHAAEYGFIQRFIDGTEKTVGEYTGYIYEAWHFRYVGIDTAIEIEELGITLEEYLGITD